jgi:hypothetical protein
LDDLLVGGLFEVCTDRANVLGDSVDATVTGIATYGETLVAGEPGHLVVPRMIAHAFAYPALKDAKIIVPATAFLGPTPIYSIMRGAPSPTGQP